MSNITVYFRYFKDQEIRESENIKISKYLPKYMKIGFSILLEEKVIDMDDYILCPLYHNEIQVGVTGGIKEKEESKAACARELGEEVGLVPISLNDLIPVVKTENKRECTCYALHIGRTSPVLKSEHKESINKEFPDTRNKVGCFVHGNVSSILAHMCQSEIYMYFSEDRIIGVGMVPVIDIIRLIKDGYFGL